MTWNSKLEGGNYKVILADPPWHFKAYSHRGESKGAAQHYGTMKLADIKCLPVSKIAAIDAALFLWVVQPMLPEALEVIEAWGFEFRTVVFCWIKMPKSWAQGSFISSNEIRPKMGLGYHTRSGMEQCWLAVRGKGYEKAPRGKKCEKHISNSVRQVIFSPVREHSRKPDEVFQRIEQLTSYGNNSPRIELFARSRREGWESWGNEARKFE